MYSIGIFSKMNRITIKTLRYYDRAGILKPAHVDNETGYRYYSSAQIVTLHEVMALRQMGFKIAEIKEAIETKTVSRMIEKKRTELQEESKKINEKIAQADYYLEKQEYTPQIFIKSLPQVIVASTRYILPNYQALFEVVPKMGKKMIAAGCKVDPIQYCFQIIHDGKYKEENIDFEICEAVTEMKENQNGLIFKEIEEVPMAACLLHRGPYETIGETYAILFDWLAHNQYELADNPREAVIDGIWNRNDSREWLTEVQFPLTKGG